MSHLQAPNLSAGALRLDDKHRVNRRISMLEVNQDPSAQWFDPSTTAISLGFSIPSLHNQLLSRPRPTQWASNEPVVCQVRVERAESPARGRADARRTGGGSSMKDLEGMDEHMELPNAPNAV
ncbi:hypothetical protein E4U55_003882 [Claviceps digitariae]|nr:hypothetical protein E4U55_003882 [Claviceps digitariae]